MEARAIYVAYDELVRMNLGRIPLIAIAKKEERIYRRGSKTPLDINRDSQLCYFIQQIRDEAHRFALRYHHKLREKNIGV